MTGKMSIALGTSWRCRHSGRLRRSLPSVRQVLTGEEFAHSIHPSFSARIVTRGVVLDGGFQLLQ